MQSVKQILKNFDPLKDKYISREFQSFGIYLTEQLDDYKHKSLYIKLAKTVHRSILEKALSFAVDSKARNRGALFMWRLKELTLQSEKRSPRDFRRRRREATPASLNRGEPKAGEAGK